MSVAAELQKLIVDLLKGDDAVAALVGTRVYDRVPAGAAFPYLSLGPHDVVDDDSEGIVGGEHTVQVDGWSRAPGGFVEAKRLGAAAKAALHHPGGVSLTGFGLVDLWVASVRYLRDPDGLTSHAVLTLTAFAEERIE